MSVWILHQKLSAETESGLLQTSHVQLPFDDVPDLSYVSNQWQCKNLLHSLHPEKPPEAIALMVDRIWQIFSNIAIDDTVAMPLPHSKMVAIARISGRYEYNVGSEGDDRHSIPVEWYPKLASFSSFGKFKQMFLDTGSPMREVTDKESRVKILEKLPHKYNRFAKWKWIALILVTLQGLSFIIAMLKQ